ncbi:MAG: ATP synthase subunit I [Veillonellales bacterium]
MIQIVLWGIGLGSGAYAAGYSSWLSGLALGTITSIVYFLFMSCRVRKSVELPPHKAVSYMRVGWAIRLIFILLMLVLSVQIPSVHFWAAVAGMLSLQVVLLLNGGILILKSLLGAVKKHPL